MSANKKVAVIDYGMGNLMSVLRAWQKVGATARLINQPTQIEEDDILVFPGQGAIAEAMALLKRTSFDKSIKEWITSDKPFFGICLGLQALFEYSEEDGGCECLGIFQGTVSKLRPPREFKVPHMGWDDAEFRPTNDFRKSLLQGIADKDQFYFVHSYCATSKDEDSIFATTEYGGTIFASAMARGKLVACQFHPEKSQSAGLKLYENFLNKVSAI